MKKIIGVIATAAVITFAGAAHAELMDSTFGNTVTVAAPDGTVVVSYQFNADHTFSMTTAEGTGAGTWTLDGYTLCSTIGDGEANCTEIEDHEVGDSWEDTDFDGNTMTISIVAGH